MGFLSFLFKNEHNSSQDKRGGVMLEGGGPVRPDTSRRGGGHNQPVAYGNGHGDAGYCRQDNFAGKITDHGTFDPFYFEHHQAETNQRFEDINNGKYFRDDDDGAPMGNVQAQRESLADTQVNYREQYPVNVERTTTGPALVHVRLHR